MEEKNVEVKEEVKETKKKKNGFVRLLYWLIIIGGCIFIFLGSYKIGYKLGDYFGEKNGTKKASTKVVKATKDKYEFNFSDGLKPGATYSGYIDLKTGAAKVEKTPGCSMLECPPIESEVEEGTLETEDLNKVIKFLEDNKYPEITLIRRSVEGEKTIDEKTLSLIIFVQYKLEANSTNSLADKIYEADIK